jgi:hypothetical protein
MLMMMLLLVGGHDHHEIPTVSRTAAAMVDDMNALFRKKATYMKTWKPASNPSVNNATGDRVHRFAKWLSSFISLIRTVIGWNCTLCTSKPLLAMHPIIW